MRLSEYHLSVCKLTIFEGAFSCQPRNQSAAAVKSRRSPTRQLLGREWRATSLFSLPGNEVALAVLANRRVAIAIILPHRLHYSAPRAA